jgi:D-alanine transaminase
VTLEQGLAADEVFITSTTRELGWVRLWDGKTIGNGKCGAITRKLHEAYMEEVLAETGADVAAA